MKTRIRNTVLCAVAALALCACSNDDAPESAARIPLTVKATIAGMNTRGTMYDDGTYTFEKGDFIYVSKLDANGGFDWDYMLIEYEYNGTEFVPKDESKTYYFEPGNLETVRFVAEYRTEGKLSTDGNISYNDGDEEITVENQSEYRMFEDLADTVTCSIRNPKITFQLKHINPKITLNFSSEVTECKVAYKFSYISYLEDGGTKENVYTNIYLCYLTTSDGKTKAEAYVGALKPLDGLTIEATTKNGYKYTAKIELPVLVANTNYIYNVNLHEGLTVVNDGTTISGYSDETSGTFTGEEVASGSTI